MKQGISFARALALLALFGVVFAATASADKRYRDDVFKKVKVQHDITYGTGLVNGQPQDLTLDVYSPKGDDVKKRPVSVWVHDGGFSFGDKATGPVPVLAKEFARKGYVSASINYRLLATGPCDGDHVVECYGAAVEAVHDAQAAVAYMRANAKRFKADKNRIVIGGASAGAITATGVGVLDGDPGDGSGPPDPTKAVGAFASISGGLPDALFTDAESAPGILFASVDDPVVPSAWSQQTYDKLVSLGIASRLSIFPGAVHIPVDEFGDVIEKQTAKFFYDALDLKNAKGS